MWAFATPQLLKSKELFYTLGRNCVHLELDLGGRGIACQTGDHAAVWPIDSDEEVDRFLRVFGLSAKRNTPISIFTVGSTSYIPIPSPTSYDAATRYYLEIEGNGIINCCIRSIECSMLISSLRHMYPHAYS